MPRFIEREKRSSWDAESMIPSSPISSRGGAEETLIVDARFHRSRAAIVEEKFSQLVAAGSRGLNVSDETIRS